MNRFQERGQDTVTSCGLTCEPTMVPQRAQVKLCGILYKTVMNMGKGFVGKKGAGRGLAGKQK